MDSLGSGIWSGFRGNSTLPVPPDWPNGQCSQIKNNDVSVGGNPVGNVGGGGWTEKYGERRYILVTVAALYAVPGLWGGVDGGSNNV